jgi:hypothetical protein
MTAYSWPRRGVVGAQRSPSRLNLRTITLCEELKNGSTWHTHRSADEVGLQREIGFHMNEIIFLIVDAPEGGYCARALGASIFTEADTEDFAATPARRWSAILRTPTSRGSFAFISSTKKCWPHECGPLMGRGQSLT